MTESKHTYTVALIGTPDVPLSLRGGPITLDARRAPHVTADVRIVTPPPAILAELDPRLGARIRVTADRESPTAAAQHREFNLGLREQPTTLEDGTTILRLASDEALLLDYRPLEDDRTPRELEGSLRDVVDYVLGVVIPGAALEPTPALDADVTAYWPLTNLVTNPSVYPGTQGYTAGINCSAVQLRAAGYVGTTSARWVSAGAGGCSILAASVAVVPGTTYYMSARIINTSSRNLRIGMSFYDPAGGKISTYESPVTVATGGYDLLEAFVTPPPGTASAVPYAIFGASGSGETAALDALLVVPSDEAVEYFQPGISTPGYTTAWESGGAGEGYAQATRTPILERDPESTIWRADQSALEFLVPLVQAAGYRIVCDELRRWTLRDENHTTDAPTLNISHAANMIDSTDTLSRDGDASWIDAAIVIYTWTDRDGNLQRRIDSYALTIPHTRARVVERPDTPYPGPGLAEYIVRRAQGRGRVVEATAVATWDATAEQMCQFVLPGGSTHTGKTDRVVFDLDRDELTAAARTTETPANAVLLLAGTVDSLPGTVASL